MEFQIKTFKIDNRQISIFILGNIELNAILFENTIPVSMPAVLARHNDSITFLLYVIVEIEHIA